MLSKLLTNILILLKSFAQYCTASDSIYLMLSRPVSFSVKWRHRSLTGNIVQSSNEVLSDLPIVYRGGGRSIPGSCSRRFNRTSAGTII